MEGVDETTPREILAAKMIDVWADDHGRRVPWAIAVKILAIITRLPNEEMTKLMELGK